MVARLCITRVVWMEISKLHYLANCAFVAAADLFALQETNGGRTALFRSHTFPAVDNVGVVLWLDRGFAFWHARGAAGFEQIRRSLPRPRARRHRSIIKPLLSQRPFEVRGQFSRQSRRNVCPNAA